MLYQASPEAVSEDETLEPQSCLQHKQTRCLNGPGRGHLCRICSGPGGRQSRNPQPPGQPRPLGVPGRQGGGPGSVSAKHVPPGGLLRPTLLPERGAESTPGAVRPPRADGLGTLGTVTFLPHAQPVPPTRPFKPPPKRQGRPVHKEVRSARLLDSSATRQQPKTPARTPASVSSHSRSQPPGPGGPCRSRNMDYSLERTSSSRFSSCSCRCRSSPWFSMTQSKSPKSSRPHSDSTSSTPAEEAQRGQAGSVWTDAGPRAWRPADRRRATRALRLLHRHCTLGPRPRPRTRTRAAGITWRVCGSVR